MTTANPHVYAAPFWSDLSLKLGRERGELINQTISFGSWWMHGNEQLLLLQVWFFRISFNWPISALLDKLNFNLYRISMPLQSCFKSCLQRCLWLVDWHRSFYHITELRKLMRQACHCIIDFYHLNRKFCSCIRNCQITPSVTHFSPTSGFHTYW